ncbi:uncharacterized protein si:dkey-220k22.3 [Hoplias malabaricus]|uniref:uncharacterized protein si:dkey-220k22.3 n=1 Tax=Hoplias malabaricus TaxID=27720 RepID=UPI0034623C6A
MLHLPRAHAGWSCALVFVAIVSSWVTWLCVQRTASNQNRCNIINSTDVPRLFGGYKNTSYKTIGTYKVNNYGSHDGRLVWNEECCNRPIKLEQNQTWITVTERGIFLIHLQVTFGLQKGNNTVDLQLFVDFNYTEGDQEYAAAFETRKLTDNEKDAQLSIFLLLKMNASDSLSVRTHPENLVKYKEEQPFSSYISIIKYADWQTT